MGDQKGAGILWCDYTFNPWLNSGFGAKAFADAFAMHFLVTILAERQAVVNIKSRGGIFSKAFEMVRVQVPALSVAAMLASKAVTLKNCPAPGVVFNGLAQSYSASRLSIFKGIVVFAPRRSFAGDLTNSFAGFGSVRLADPVAGSSFSGVAHLLASFRAHLFALHRRNERLAPLDPSIAQFLSCFFGDCHTFSIPSILAKGGEF